MFKRFLLVIAMIAVVFSLSIISYAGSSDENDEIQQRYDNATSAAATLTHSGNNATSTATLIGKTGVTKIKCTMTLQKKNSGQWDNVQSWSKEVAARTLSFSKSRTISHGTYRTRAKFKVYKGTSYESITVYSSQVTY